MDDPASAYPGLCLIHLTWVFSSLCLTVFLQLLSLRLHSISISQCIHFGLLHLSLSFSVPLLWTRFLPQFYSMWFMLTWKVAVKTLALQLCRSVSNQSFSNAPCTLCCWALGETNDPKVPQALWLNAEYKSLGFSGPSSEVSQYLLPFIV